MLIPALTSLSTPIQISNRFESLTQLVLRSGNIKSPSINDDGLRLITSRFPNLTRFKLYACPGITYQGMVILSQNCKKLKKFSCSFCGFGAKGVIKSCYSLEELFVRYLRSGHLFEPFIIRSNSLKTLKLISTYGDWGRCLEMIAVLDNSLVEVHSEDVHVSDTSLLALSKCSRLQLLHLKGLLYCTNTVFICVAEHCNYLKKLHIGIGVLKNIGNEALIAIAKYSLNLQQLVLIGV